MEFQLLRRGIEEWRDLPKFEGRYKVSNYGNVLSLPNSRRDSPLVLSQRPDSRGYNIVNLTHNDGSGWRQKVYKVHRLVLLGFVGEAPADKPFGCHKDGNRGNNRLSNLYWGSPLENSEDSRNHGTTPRGTRNGKSVLTEEEVRKVKVYLSEDTTRGCKKRCSEAFNLNYRTVVSISSGQNWNWL